MLTLLASRLGRCGWSLGPFNYVIQAFMQLLKRVKRGNTDDRKRQGGARPFRGNGS